MGKIAMLLGGILMALGIGFYVATGGKSITAMIPTFVGLPIVICGALALNPNRTKAAMHAAVVFGFLGWIGSFSRAAKLPAVLTGNTLVSNGKPVDPIVVWESAALNIVCLIFVVLCVKSFVNARRSRETQAIL